MSSLRDVKDDLLKNWLYFRDEDFCSLVNAEDRKHMIKFDEFSDIILKSIPKQNRPFVQKQLNKLDDNVMDYIGYWNEKYFRNGFCDGIELIKIIKFRPKIFPWSNFYFITNLYIFFHFFIPFVDFFSNLINCIVSFIFYHCRMGSIIISQK